MNNVTRDHDVAVARPEPGKVWPRLLRAKRRWWRGFARWPELARLGCSCSCCGRGVPLDAQSATEPRAASETRDPKGLPARSGPISQPKMVQPTVRPGMLKKGSSQTTW